jgi:hypothetical protein
LFTEYAAPNQINHLIKYKLIHGVDYHLKVHYETNNMFQETWPYEDSDDNPCIVKHLYGGLPVPKLQISATSASEGRIKILLSTLGGGIIHNGLVITRSSNLDKFLVWEDVHNVVLENASLDDYVWYDNTVQNGVFYKYAV